MFNLKQPLTMLKLSHIQSSAFIKHPSFNTSDMDLDFPGDAQDTTRFQINSKHAATACE